MDDYIYGDTIRFSWVGHADDGQPVAGSNLTFAVYAHTSSSQISPDGLTVRNVTTNPGLPSQFAIVTQDNNYESNLSTPTHYTVVCTGGTIGGVSMAGEVVYQFWLNRLANTQDISASMFETSGGGSYAASAPDSPVRQTADNAAGNGGGGSCDAVYHARIAVKRVTVSSQEFKVTWFLNGMPLPKAPSEATNVRLYAEDNDGNVQITEKTMTESGAGTGLFTHTATGVANNNTIPTGDVWKIDVTASIDGSDRIFRDLVAAPL